MSRKYRGAAWPGASNYLVRVADRPAVAVSGRAGGSGVRRQVAIAASPTTLYLATVNRVARSTDGGVHWSRTSITAPADVVAIDPNHPTTVYAAADQVYVSADDGSTWTPLLSVPLHSVATIAPTSAGLFIGSVRSRVRTTRL